MEAMLDRPSLNDSLVLAEFVYSGQPAETFPFDQPKEHFSMFALKKFGLPAFYWHRMLPGRVRTIARVLPTPPMNQEQYPPTMINIHFFPPNPSCFSC
jgi:hypothetical protein